MRRMLTKLRKLHSSLARLAGLTRRFSKSASRCTPDIFLAMGGVHRELQSAEKRVDALIDAQRTDAFSDTEALDEVERYVVCEFLLLADADMVA